MLHRSILWLAGLVLLLASCAVSNRAKCTNHQ